jgi:putative DNA primase/helicase
LANYCANSNGLLVYRDELVSLLKTLDREDNAETRGFYLTAWNGDSGYTIDRIGRGMHLHIPAVCLSVLGSTQPGRIADYLRTAIRGGAGDDGLIQRFGLLVWPDTSGWQDVDRWPDTKVRQAAQTLFDYLDQLDPNAVGARQEEYDEVPYLRFDDAALDLSRDWRADLEAKLRSELHPALEAHLAKYRKLVPGLALICHLASRGTGLVTKTATLQAVAWGEYLESHARRAYASVTASEVATAKAIMQKLCSKALPHSFSARDIYRHQWARLSDPEQVAKALQLLVDLDQLAVHSEETTGRPRVIYTANPRALT